MVLGRQMRAVWERGSPDGRFLSVIPIERVEQFIKFCVVGGTGFLVDMAILYVLADPASLALNVTLSKICAAGTAMTSNFFWNELWTFREKKYGMQQTRGWLRRFIIFSAICGIGIALAVFLLHLFYSLLGWNLYLSNIAAIGLVTAWNFGMNAGFNWRSCGRGSSKNPRDKTIRGGSAGSRVSLTVLVLIVLIQTSLFVSAAVKIDGSMELFWPKASTPTNHHFQFSCLVQDNGWRISTRNPFYGNHELAKVGTNLFGTRSVSWDKVAPPITNSSARTVRVQGTVSLDENNAIPVSWEFFDHVLWLAYCRSLRSSGEFHQSKISARVVYHMDYSTNLACTALWHSQDPSALQELQIFNPGVLLTTSGKRIPLSAPFSDGYLTGEFNGVDFVQAGNGFFPRRAWFAVFTPKRFAVIKEDLDPTSQVLIQAASIKVVPDEDDLRPVVKDVMSVIDYRFRALAVKEAVYITTNGWWLPTDRNFMALAAQIKREDEEQKVIPLNRKLAIGLFVIAVLLPVFFLFRSRASTPAPEAGNSRRV